MNRSVLSVLCGGLLSGGLLGAMPAHAGFVCTGPLSSAQAEGFKQLFKPAYSPSLEKVGPKVAPEDFSKKMTAAQVKALTVDKPVVAATSTLDASSAKWLKEALNANAQSSVPGWFSTVMGAFIPAAWIGISADVMIQLVNGAGDAGRLSLANLAGTVGVGGNVAVVQRVGKNQAGVQKFIWAYTHTANLNGKNVVALLYSCSSDIVVT